jgi:membrane protease YdiL (CAAX protease family)
MDWDPGLCPHRVHRRSLDRVAHQQCGDQPGHSVGSRRNGLSPLANVAVFGRQVEAAKHLGSATPLSTGQVSVWAFLAGALSIVALVGFWIVLLQLVKLPTRVLPNFSGYPLLPVALILVMSALVSSLAEEAGFRGYFQGALERKVRGPVAIVIMSLVIAPAHGLTQGFVWPILLWYFCVDVMFGTMAYLTRSILPGTVVHILGLLIFFTLVWPYDAQRQLIWETGANTGFWINVAQAIIFSTLAFLAFRRLAKITKHVYSVEVNPKLPASDDEPAGSNPNQSPL